MHAKKIQTLFEDVKILNMMNMYIDRLWICHMQVVVLASINKHAST